MANYTFYSDLAGGITLAEGKRAWLKMMGIGEYQHPSYGKIQFTPERLARFLSNIKNRVRGIDPDIDYEHKADPAKGNKAAGWVKDAELRADGLYGLVEFTPSAVTEIKDGEWRYFSPEFQDEWTDAQGVTHQDVLMGGGLTNRPFLKDLLPVNLSELTFAKPGTTQKEKEVDPKKLREQLGLPEAATDEQVDAKLAELKKLSETQPPKPPNTPTAQDLATQLSEQIKQMAGTNPALTALLETQKQLAEAQSKQLAEMQMAFRLSEMQRKFNEMSQGGKYALAPAQRDTLQAAMLTGDSTKLSEAVWGLLANIREGKAFAELGERGFSGQPGSTNTGGGDPQDKFMSEVEAYQKKFKETNGKDISFADAATEVSKQDGGKLFNEYADAALSFKI